MIALLTGNIAYKSPDHIILDVHGVGYRIHIPFSTYYELPEEGGTASLHIHTNVREDAILLYGFRTRLEKSFFQLLISVSGIGPKLGRDILSNIQPGPLSQALAHGDLGKLSTIPGIGKKTAERLVLELKDKIGKLDTSSLPASQSHTTPADDVTEDVVSALLNLGYKEPLVRKALSGLELREETTLEGLLKQALKVLMK